jgi:hypothetical protein
MRKIKKDNHKYELKKIERTLILMCYGKLYIMIAIRKHIMMWYHEHICHPGANRT